MRQGDIFRNIRKERGFNQEKLTEGLCSRSTLASFETKGSYLSVELCSKFLDRLNLRANTYFNLISEDYDSKRKSFNTLQKHFDKENNHPVEESKKVFYEKYLATQDIYWFHLYLLSVEYLGAIKDNFSYDLFKRTYKDEIRILKDYLFKVENWDHFEFALFSNSIWYFVLDFVLLMPENSENNFEAYNQERTILYAKYFINYGFYCLEYGHFSMLEIIKEELFKSATYETLHWKIIGTFQYTLARELSEKKPSDSSLTIIQHYLAFGEQAYYHNLVSYRERLLEKYKVG